MESFYSQGEGAVISASINKCVYLTINKKFGGDIRLSYNQTEISDNVNHIQHPIVRESLKQFGIYNSLRSHQWQMFLLRHKPGFIWCFYQAY